MRPIVLVLIACALLCPVAASASVSASDPVTPSYGADDCLYFDWSTTPPTPYWGPC